MPKSLKIPSRIGYVWCASFLLAPIFASVLGVAQADGSTISASEAINHAGERVTVCGLVASTKYSASSRGQPTFLNLDQPYPNHIFTAVIWGSDRTAFQYAPESLMGSRICVTGKVAIFQKKAEIIIKEPSQLPRGS